MSEEIDGVSELVQSQNIGKYPDASKAKVFDTQEAARIRQAIQEAQQAQPLLRAEQSRVSNVNPNQTKETKNIPLAGREQANQPTNTIRPPEIHAEESRAKVYTAEQLAAVRIAIQLEQTQKETGKNS